MMTPELIEVQKAGETVPGFRTGIQAEELIKLSFGLKDDPVIVEIGTYLGRGSAYMAGARLSAPTAAASRGCARPS